MMIHISNKLEQVDHRIRLLEEEKGINHKIKSLISQINNLKVGENNN